MNPVLSMLGLALRGGRLAVGDEPTTLAVRAGAARLLLTTQDAGGSTLRRAEHLAEIGKCLWLTIPFPKTELGGALGRGSAAIAAVTDLGLAAAIVKRLAALDQEAYGEAAERMALKVHRAAERKKTPRRKPPEKPEAHLRPAGRHPEKPRKHPEERRGKGEPRGAERPPEARPRRPGGFQRAEDRPGKRPYGKPPHGSGQKPGRRSNPGRSGYKPGSSYKPGSGRKPGGGR